MFNHADDFRIQFNWKNLLVMLILFSILFFYIILIGIDKVISSLLSADLFLLLLAFLIYYSSLLIRSFRWKAFLNSIDNQNKGDISYWSIYSLITFSFALNNVFPLRMGELYRPYELAKTKDYSFIFSIATVILERTFDIVVMGSLVIVAAMVQGLGNILNESEIFVNLLLSVILISIFVVVLLFLTREKSTYFLVKILNIIVGITQKKLIVDEEQTAQRVSTEISQLMGNRQLILLGSITSCFIWLLEGITFWVITLSMTINLSLVMAIFILLISGLLGNSITSASGLSQLPFMVAQLVLLAEIPQELALSISIIYLFIVFWLIIPIGLIFRELEKIRRKNRMVKETDE